MFHVLTGNQEVPQGPLSPGLQSGPKASWEIWQAEWPSGSAGPARMAELWERSECPRGHGSVTALPTVRQRCPLPSFLHTRVLSLLAAHRACCERWGRGAASGNLGRPLRLLSQGPGAAGLGAQVGRAPPSAGAWALAPRAQKRSPAKRWRPWPHPGGPFVGAGPAAARPRVPSLLPGGTSLAL